MNRTDSVLLRVLFFGCLIGLMVYGLLYAVLLGVAYAAMIAGTILSMPLFLLAMGFVVLSVAVTVPPRPDLPVDSTNLTCQEQRQWGPDISFKELVETSSMNASSMLSYLSTDAAEYTQKLYDECAVDEVVTTLTPLLVILVLLGLCSRHDIPEWIPPCMVILGFTLMLWNCGLEAILLWMTNALMTSVTLLGAVVVFPLLEKLGLAHMEWWIAICIPLRSRVVPVTVPMVCFYGCRSVLDLIDLGGAATEIPFKSLGESWKPCERIQEVKKNLGLQSVKELVPWGWCVGGAKSQDAFTDVMTAWDLVKVENLMIGGTYSATAVISAASAMRYFWLQWKGEPIDAGTRKSLVDVQLFESVIQFAITAVCVFVGHDQIDEFVFYSMVGNAISLAKHFIQWWSPPAPSQPDFSKVPREVDTACSDNI